MNCAVRASSPTLLLQPAQPPSYHVPLAGGIVAVIDQELAAQNGDGGTDIHVGGRVALLRRQARGAGQRGASGGRRSLGQRAALEEGSEACALVGSLDLHDLSLRAGGVGAG